MPTTGCLSSQGVVIYSHIYVEKNNNNIWQNDDGELGESARSNQPSRAHHAGTQHRRTTIYKIQNGIQTQYVYYTSVYVLHINNMLSITTRSQPTMSIINNFILSLSLRAYKDRIYIGVPAMIYIYDDLYTNDEWTTQQQKQHWTEEKKSKNKDKYFVIKWAQANILIVCVCVKVK